MTWTDIYAVLLHEKSKIYQIVCIIYSGCDRPICEGLEWETSTVTMFTSSWYNHREFYFVVYMCIWIFFSEHLALV